MDNLIDIMKEIRDILTISGFTMSHDIYSKKINIKMPDYNVNINGVNNVISGGVSEANMIIELFPCKWEEEEQDMSYDFCIIQMFMEYNKNKIELLNDSVYPEDLSHLKDTIANIINNL